MLTLGSPGFAFAFLILAPATNLATLLLLLNKTKPSLSSSYSTSPLAIISKISVALVTSSLLLSLAFDYFELDVLISEDESSAASMFSVSPEFVNIFTPIF
eukprot:Awhi_evm1s14173